MFDAQERVILVNRRYLDMYKLSPDVVKPGCTLRELIQHRKETGLFVDDVDAYCQRMCSFFCAAAPPGLMLRSAAQQRVSKHEAAPSFETHRVPRCSSG